MSHDPGNIYRRAQRAAKRLEDTSHGLVGRYPNPIEYVREVLGQDLWQAQEEIFRKCLEPPYKVLVKSCHSVGKCVHADEYIPLAYGGRVRACDLVGQSFPVFTLVDGKPVATEAFASWNVVEPTFIITTETGRRIIRNSEHPLWAAEGIFRAATHPKITSLGWTPVSELKVGQLLAMAEQLPSFGYKRLPHNEIKLLAYMIGDGGMTTSSTTFSQQNNQQLAEFNYCANGIGSCLKRGHSPYDYKVSGTSTERVNKPDRNGRMRAMRVNPLNELLRKHGIDCKHSRDKFIPAEIWELNAKCQSIFLSRLYATDGWASVSDKNWCEIGYCTVSERLARDVQEMLLHFGVSAILRRRNDVNAWCVEIHAAEECLRFAEKIGMYGKEKALKRVCEVSCKKRSRQGWRKKKACLGTRWERIKSIEKLPESRTVAISVPSYHTYLTQFWEHNSFSQGCLVNWWFDTFDPSVCISTAPTARDVKDVLWSEVRLLRGGKRQGSLGGFIGAAAPELRDSQEHYAKGYTANKAESFQGRHRKRMLFLFDEAVGVAPVFWQTAKSMFKPDGYHAWVCSFNPTDTSSQAFAEEMSGGWHVVTMSAPQHPNLLAELRKEPPPFPAAISLAQFEEWLRDWCDELGPHETPVSTDLHWPPPQYATEEKPSKWYRPGPLMECRALGKWPSQATYGVWSDWAWEVAATLVKEPAKGVLPRIGCDVAVHGDDYTALHVQCDGIALQHERHNGWEPDVTAGRIKQLCQWCADWYNARHPKGMEPIRPEQIPVNIDADGPGWGVMSHRGGYNFIAVCGMNEPIDKRQYFNRRTENWFNTAKQSKAGRISFARLDKDTKNRLRLQLMAPRWAPNAGGQCQVEKKADTKKRMPSLGSPDDADAVNLAYFQAPEQSYVNVEPSKPSQDGSWRDTTKKAHWAGR